MSKAEHSSIVIDDKSTDDEWIVIQPFIEGSGQPKYELSTEDATRNRSFESDLVVIRRTSALDGRSQSFTVPKAVLEHAVDEL